MEDGMCAMYVQHPASTTTGEYSICVICVVVLMGIILPGPLAGRQSTAGVTHITLRRTPSETLFSL